MTITVVNTKKRTIKTMKGIDGALHIQYATITNAVSGKKKPERGVIRLQDPRKGFVSIPKHGYITIEETGTKDPRRN